MVIYRLTNRRTGMSYIGVTSQAVSARCSHHRRVAGFGAPYPLSVAIREHGWESFDVDVLAHASSKAEAMAMEKAAIVLHQTLTPHGYNLTPGGAGSGSPSAATREKLREYGKRRYANGWRLHGTKEGAIKGAQNRRGGQNWGARPLYFDGKEYDCIEAASTATGLSRAQIVYRIKRHGLGRFLTESKRESFVGRMNVGRKATDEQRQHMSESRSGAKHYRARAIEIDGVAYPSITDAATTSGYSYMQLKTRLKDGRARYLTDSHYVVTPNERQQVSESRRNWWATLPPEEKVARVDKMRAGRTAPPQ